MNKFYVYVWIKSKTCEPFYVGKGTGNRYKSQKGRNTYFKNVYNKYECESIIVSPLLEERQAFDLERAVIREQRCLGYRLANLTDGGEGCSGRVVTDAYRKKYSIMNTGKGNPNYGHRWTQEMKDHMSSIAKSRHLEKGNNPKAHRVMCVETGQIYDCLQTPTEELGLKSSASIIVALKNPTKTARRYHWVDGSLIDSLNTPEKRKHYLETLSQ